MMRDTANGTALLAIAHDYRPPIFARRDDIETSRRLPEDLAHDLAHAGFFRIFLPAAYGGLDLTPMDGIAVIEELAKADRSHGVCGTGIRIGLQRSFPLRRRTPSMTIRMLSRPTVRAPLEKRMSSMGLPLDRTLVAGQRRELAKWM